jgi:mannosyltransferase
MMNATTETSTHQHWLPASLPRWLELALLGCVCAVAAWLRWTDIGAESLWTDELYSLHWASKSVAQIFANASFDVHPPTYYVLLHYWLALFGDGERSSELVLRGFSALCAVLTIPLFYALGKHLCRPELAREFLGFESESGEKDVRLPATGAISTRSAETVPAATGSASAAVSPVFPAWLGGFVAALLLTFSHFHVFYAAEARNYTFTVLCVVWSMLAFVRVLPVLSLVSAPASAGGFLRVPSAFGRIAHFVIATIAMMHTHLFALFVVVAQNAFVLSLVLCLVLSRVSSRASLSTQQPQLATSILLRWTALQCVLLVLFAPWLRILLHQIFAVGKQGFWIEDPTAYTLVETFAEYAGGVWLLVLFAAMIVANVLPSSLRHSRHEHDEYDEHDSQHSEPQFRLLASPVFMLLLWLGLTIAIPLVKSFASKPAIYYIKYTIPALPAFLLLAVLGLKRLVELFSAMPSSAPVLKNALKNALKNVSLAALVLIWCALGYDAISSEWTGEYVASGSSHSSHSSHLSSNSSQNSSTTAPPVASLNKERWRETAQMLDSLAAPDDAILVHQWYYEWALDYYCRKPHHCIAPVPSQFLALRPAIVERLVHHATTGLGGQRKRVWLVLAQKNPQHTLILNALAKQGYKPSSEQRSWLYAEEFRAEANKNHALVLSSHYRKYFVRDAYGASAGASAGASTNNATAGEQVIVSLLKTYWTPHVTVLCFVRE